MPSTTAATHELVGGILLSGGGFLLFKGTREIHLRVDGADEDEATHPTGTGFVTTIAQIVLFDLVFSLDSVITAVGIAEDIRVMVAAIVAAILLMLVRRPSVFDPGQASRHRVNPSGLM